MKNLDISHITGNSSDKQYQYYYINHIKVKCFVNIHLQLKYVQMKK